MPDDNRNSPPGPRQTARREIGKEQKAQALADKQMAERLASLMAHPGFTDLKNLAATIGNNYLEQLQAQLPLVMNTESGQQVPLDGHTLALRQEYNKGALHGIRLALSLPASKIASVAKADSQGGNGDDDA